MSIILKGIDMPKQNQICKIEIHSDGHCAVMKIEEGECYSLEFNSETKAIQIPTPHGRIIDESDLTDELTELNDLNLESLAPTILESEE